LGNKNGDLPSFIVTMIMYRRLAKAQGTQLLGNHAITKKQNGCAQL
jgi:hypothetical protein